MTLHEIAYAFRPLQAGADGGGPTTAPRGAAAPYWLLVVLAAIGPASFQIFLPSLPAIRDGFGVGEGTAQLALSLSMLGIALATLAYGRLADRFGRRPVLLAGMVLLLAGSVLCAMAPGIGWLIAGRIVQAAGGASGMVVTRAIVLDISTAASEPGRSWRGCSRP